MMCAKYKIKSCKETVSLEKKSDTKKNTEFNVKLKDLQPWKMDTLIFLISQKKQKRDIICRQLKTTTIAPCIFLILCFKLDKMVFI